MHTPVTDFRVNFELFTLRINVHSVTKYPIWKNCSILFSYREKQTTENLADQTRTEIIYSDIIESYIYTKIEEKIRMPVTVNFNKK